MDSQARARVPGSAGAGEAKIWEVILAEALNALRPVEETLVRRLANLQKFTSAGRHKSRSFTTHLLGVYTESVEQYRVRSDDGGGAGEVEGHTLSSAIGKTRSHWNADSVAGCETSKHWALLVKDGMLSKCGAKFVFTTHLYGHSSTWDRTCLRARGQ